MSRSVILLSLASLAALGAGFLREVVAAHAFGASAPADALAVMLFYTDAFSVVVVSGIGAYALVPALARYQASHDLAGSHRLINVLLAWVGLLTLPVMAAALAWPRTLAAWVAPAFSPRQHALLAELIPAAGLVVVSLALSAIFVGGLQTAARYSVAALSRGLLGLGMAAGIALGAGRWGSLAGGVGLLAGATAQLGLLAAAMWRLGWRPAWPRLRHPDLAAALAAGLPILMVLVFSQLVVGGLQRALASSLPEGSLAAVNYANRAMNLLASVSVAFGTVALTELSVSFSREGFGPDARLSLENSLQGAVFVFAPLSAAMFLLAEPIVALLYQRGQYDDAALALTAACVRWYALAGVSGVVASVLFRAYPAFRRSWRLLAVGGVAAVTTLLVTAWMLRAGAGAAALPIGYSVGMTVNCVVNVLGLWDLLGGRLVWNLARYVLRVTLMTALAAALLLAAGPVMAGWAAALAPGWGNLARLGLGAALLGGTYLALALATREPQAARLWQAATRRLAAWRAASAEG